MTASAPRITTAGTVATLLLLCLCACRQAAPGPEHIEGQAQGTYYSISYYDAQHRDLQGPIDSLLAAFDQTASLWVDSSLLRRVNENSDSIVNDDFAQLTTLSVAMHQLTDGAFDCTVGPLVSAWGFSFRSRQPMSDAAVDSLRRYVGQQPTLECCADGQYILHKPYPQTALDFNAIAQGYSTDLIARYLDRQGITDYIVDVGGEVYARGGKPDGSPWRIGVERPAANKYSQRELASTIGVRDMAVVTSGSYRKYYEENGVRYSHTIDPVTGRPVRHTLLSVTVVDTAAWRADALATAFMVMGLERAKAFIAAHPDDSGTQAVYFIYDEAGDNKTYATPAFEKLILTNK